MYVDDIILTDSDKAGIQETKDFLKSVFKIKDLVENTSLELSCVDPRKACSFLKGSIHLIF